MPSEYAKAYENIEPSVVRVISYVKKSRLKEDKECRGRKARPSPSPWARHQAATSPKR